MQWKLAKGVQFIGLVVVAQALVLGLVIVPERALRYEFQFLLIGVVVFLAGYFWEQKITD